MQISTHPRGAFVTSKKNSKKVPARLLLPLRWLGRVCAMSDDSDSDYVDDAPPEQNTEAVTPTRVRSSRACAKTPTNYDAEKRDTFFCDLPGYSNFHRTRKSGDKRPNAANKVMLLHTHNLFMQTFIVKY